MAKLLETWGIILRNKMMVILFFQRKERERSLVRDKIKTCKETASGHTVATEPQIFSEWRNQLLIKIVYMV